MQRLLEPGVGALPLRQQRGLQQCRDQRFQVVPADARVRVLGLDDFALFGQPDVAAHAAGRLRQDRLEAWPTAAPDRAAAAMEQPQLHAVILEQVAQLLGGLVQRPVGGEEAAILVAVRVAEHHFLQRPRRAGAGLHQQMAQARMRDQLAHDLRRALQVVDGLEQRHHHQRAAAHLIAGQQPGLLLQQCHFEQVGQRLRVRDDVLVDRGVAVGLAQCARCFEHRQFRACAIAVVQMGRQQRPGVAQLVRQQSNAFVFRQR